MPDEKIREGFVVNARGSKAIVHTTQGSFTLSTRNFYRSISLEGAHVPRGPKDSPQGKVFFIPSSEEEDIIWGLSVAA